MLIPWLDLKGGPLFLSASAKHSLPAHNSLGKKGDLVTLSVTHYLFSDTIFQPDSLILLDFLESQALPTSPPTVSLSALWTVLLDGLNPIWPSRLSLGGVALGDVWPCPSLAQMGPDDPESDTILVPFHKLTQWLAYSLVEVLQKTLGWKVEGLEDMTGLPEYRNGIYSLSFSVPDSIT